MFRLICPHNLPFIMCFFSQWDRGEWLGSRGSGEGPRVLCLMGPLLHSAAAVSQDYSAVWFHQMRQRRWTGTV